MSPVLLHLQNSTHIFLVLFYLEFIIGNYKANAYAWKV